MKYFKLIIALFLIFVITSCGSDIFHDVNTEGLSKDEGLVEFNLNVSNSIKDVKSSQDLNLDVNDFTVEVFNSKWVKFKKWEKYSDISGQRVKFNQGTFSVKAFYGDSTATGFDAVYFADQKYFTVFGQQLTNLALVCKQANVGLKTQWGENIQNDYSDYTVKAYRKGYADSLTFVKSETRTGYIPAGTIKFVFYLTDKETGTTRRVATSSLDIEGDPNDMITLKIDTKEAAKGDLNISFSIDSEMGSEQKDIVIPSILLAKDAPKISSDNIQNSNITTIDGIAVDARLDLNAQGYINSCVIETSSEYLVSKGWPASVDLANMNDDTSTLLQTWGLDWIRGMKGEKLSYIDFTNVIKKLVYVDASDVNTFKITLTDAQGLTAEYSFNVKINKADFQVLAINGYDMWARWANVSMSSSNGDLDLLALEYYNGTNWAPASTEVISSESGVKRVKVTGLNPAFNYKFRARYNGYNLSGEVSGTTEAASQVANSGFEDFYQDVFKLKITLGGTKDQPIFYPWASGSSNKVWDTTNLDTMPSETSTSSQNYKCFPSVSYSTTKRSGSKSAQLMAIAVNWWNTSGTSNSDAKAGKLFIGSYSGGTTGTSFGSRPEKLSFYYQYKPKGGSDSDTFQAYIEVRNGTTVIGKGTFEKNVAKSSPVTSWQQAVTNITYTRTDLKATSIYVHFLSTTMSKPTYEVGTKVTLAGTEYGCHGGSILLLDDMELLY